MAAPAICVPSRSFFSFLFPPAYLGEIFDCLSPEKFNHQVDAFLDEHHRANNLRGSLDGDVSKVQCFIAFMVHWET